MARSSREAYARLYGPTKGDLIRLGDTELLVEIEHDYAVYGHELVSAPARTCATARASDPYAAT